MHCRKTMWLELLVADRKHPLYNSFRSHGIDTMWNSSNETRSFNGQSFTYNRGRTFPEQNTRKAKHILVSTELPGAVGHSVRHIRQNLLKNLPYTKWAKETKSDPHPRRLYLALGSVMHVSSSPWHARNFWRRLHWYIRVQKTWEGDLQY